MDKIKLSTSELTAEYDRYQDKLIQINADT